MLTFTEFSGSPYHIGLSLGKLGAPAVHNTLMSSDIWEHTMQWRGSEQLAAMQTLVQQHHPYLWDELQGLARGLELPPEDVFLWNCHGDLPPWCESTTILMPTPQGPRISYHLAGDPAVADYCGIVEFIVDQGAEFASFIYPGFMSGHALSVTGTGLCIAVNTAPTQHVSPGIPGRILTRALLHAADLSSAIQLLNDSPRSGHFHLSLAQRGGSALLSTETSPEKVSIQHATTATLQTNHLTHDAMQDQAPDSPDSSRLRLKKGLALLNGPEAVDPLQLLADLSRPTGLQNHNTTAESSNQAQTLVIADLHVQADAVHWDIYEHPDKPVRFRMRDAKHI